jgi:hypothetical protein
LLRLLSFFVSNEEVGSERRVKLRSYCFEEVREKSTYCFEFFVSKALHHLVPSALPEWDRDISLLHHISHMFIFPSYSHISHISILLQFPYFPYFPYLPAIFPLPSRFPPYFCYFLLYCSISRHISPISAVLPYFPP